MKKEQIRLTEVLRSYLEEKKPTRYQIENQLLAGATDFLKNGYLKMLGLLLRQSDNIEESQLLLFRRIIAGAAVDVEAQEYMRMTMGMDADEIAAFIEGCAELSLKYRFVLDTMILIGVGRNRTEQEEVLAGVCEALELTLDEVKYLVSVARAVLQLDATLYADAEEENITDISGDILQGYLKLISKDGIYSNGNVMIFHPTGTENVTVQALNRITETETACVKLVNVEMSLEEYSLVFRNRDKVILERCRFKGGKKYAVQFLGCKEIVVRNSCFEGFSSMVMEIYENSFLKILQCKFKKCIYEYRNSSSDWIYLGGVIYGEAMGETEIEGCTFESCGGRNSSNYYRSAFLSNCDCKVTNSAFVCCWHYHNDTEIDPDDKKRTMFTPGSVAVGCRFDNSAAF